MIELRNKDGVWTLRVVSSQIRDGKLKVSYQRYKTLAEAVDDLRQATDVDGRLDVDSLKGGAQ